ncbi:DUF6084 family protein [Nocardia sp. alder85J]|uniref:DUF6084 family protein n=1 Tax=Nocardia sp. alder85J TaxID=2862949 RepID=UPI001CD735DB|nr:DUF6084 family protein [Nocardia sp. alder85J]MCX4098103.1 DUF6084 family protein [Nocardia sp. alder85J]
MTETCGLALTVTGIGPEPYALTPALSARVALTTPADEPVHAIALRAQVRIEPYRRGYSDEESTGLTDLFGPRERWHDTQRSFLWMHCATMVPGFRESAEVELPLPCTYDFEVAGSKYLHALREGTVPLLFLFSGTVFVKGGKGFAIRNVPWDRDCGYDMPISVWRELMAGHFPDSGWLRLSRTTLDALSTYKSRRGLLGYDDAMAELLAAGTEAAS